MYSGSIPGVPGNKNPVYLNLNLYQVYRETRINEPNPGKLVE